MSIIIFILILAVLIIVHEYGHFIVAKKWGIRVDEFGIGYPPRAKVLFKRKGTLFTLNWIPFGGFVKIFGEDPSDLSTKPAETGESLNGENKDVALISKSKFAQASVMFAGPLFNFIFAWLIILLTLFIGLPTSIDGVNSKYITDSQMIVLEVLPNSPIEKSGIIVNDILKNISFNGEEFNSLKDIILNQSNIGNSISVEVVRNKEILQKEILIEEYIIQNNIALGVGFQEVGIYKPPFFKSILESFKISGDMIFRTVKALGSLIIDAFRGRADMSNLTGPVGIVSLVGNASSLGTVYLLIFTALISINLGIINLIPFPALDGGRILFLIIEKIKGSPISPKVSNFLNSVGFLILIILMIVITFRDIIRIFL